jgi:DUF4097 and DUF4098 domain-containing protein YvlB
MALSHYDECVLYFHIPLCNASGDTKISTGGGNIEIENCSGSVTARSGSGNISLSKVYGSVNASTNCGDLKIGMMFKKAAKAVIGIYKFKSK